MSAGTAATAVVKNRTTDRDRAFWSHVESVAAQSSSIRERHLPQMTDSRDDALTHKDGLGRPGDDDHS